MVVLKRGELGLWLLGALVAALTSLALLGGPVLHNDSFQYLSEADAIVAGQGARTSLIHFEVEYAHGSIPAPLTTFPRVMPWPWRRCAGWAWRVPGPDG